MTFPKVDRELIARKLYLWSFGVKSYNNQKHMRNIKNQAYLQAMSWVLVNPVPVFVGLTTL
jgi:hypothetical protein